MNMLLRIALTRVAGSFVFALLCFSSVSAYAQPLWCFGLFPRPVDAVMHAEGYFTACKPCDHPKHCLGTSQDDYPPGYYGPDGYPLGSPGGPPIPPESGGQPNPNLPPPVEPDPPPDFPFLEGAVAAALAVAAGLAAGVLGLVGAPALAVGVAGALAINLGIAAAVGLAGGGTGEPPPNAQAAADNAPFIVNIEPAANPAGAPGGLPGDAPSVGVDPDGGFAPTGGPAAPAGGGEGWASNGGGDWSYTPPASASNPNPSPSIVITEGGAVVAGTGPADGQTVVITKASGGEIIFTTTAVIPVVTVSGEQTTVPAQTSVVYGGTNSPATSSSTSVGQTLGNGGSAGGGFTPTGGTGGTGVVCGVGTHYSDVVHTCVADDTGTGDTGDGTGDCSGGPCATESTQVANKGLLQDFKDFFTGGNADAPSSGDEPTGSDIASAGVGKGDFAALLAWRIPAHSKTCPTSSFSWEGRTFTFDAHCQLVDDHFGVFRNVMIVVFTLSALFIVLKA